SNRIFLKPNWLTRAMSRVLDSERVRANRGVLEHAWFAHIWERDEEGRPYDPEHYPLFLRLMERFLISFQLEADTVHHRPARSLVPLLLPHAPPAELAPWDGVLPGQPEIRMVFRLKAFVPPGLMSWFIVLTHHYTQGLHWREGVRVAYEGHQAEAVLNPSTGEFWLRARGPAPSNFFNILQHTINDRILRHFYTGLVYRRQVPCNCHEKRGAAEACGYFHAYERLVERMRQGRLEAECGEWFVMVSVPELLEGIHYTTHDRVERKLDAVVHKLDQARIGIADLTTLSTEIRDNVVTIVQGFEDLRRNFSRLWNAQMAQLEAECPNVFVLMPGGRAALHPKNVLGTQYTLYLLCQHPVGPHIVGGEPGYNVTIPKEWWAQTAPWLKKLLDYLRYIPKGKAFVEAYDEALYKEVEAGIKVLEAALSLAPSLEGEPPAGQPSERSRFGAVTSEGPALRGFYTFLKELDKHERWCGLTKILTNDGNLLWLCREHLPLYEPH
ncbi:MAG TPA: COR domain-containing protein, partial [Ardenticatenaceae bacterium]|nr:COR domain-containing protein [Ardenticatenaceae bacterium]